MSSAIPALITAAIAWLVVSLTIYAGVLAWYVITNKQPSRDSGLKLDVV